MDRLTENLRTAVEADQPPASTEPEELALEISTMLTGADIAYLLHEDPRILARIGAAIRRRLGP